MSERMNMSTSIAMLALGILLGSGLRKMLVPITPDGRTEAQIIEEAYTAGYHDGYQDKSMRKEPKL